MGDWSQLPLDLLSLIADRISLRDSIRLGCVCLPWRSALPPARHRGRLPWLLLSPTPTQGIAFFSLLDHQFYNMDLPQLTNRRIFGSSNGWLITLHQNGDIILFNPLSTKLVHLPSLFKIPGVYGMKYSNEQFLCIISDHQLTPPTRHQATLHDALVVRDTFIRKAIVSSAQVVVGIVGQFRKLLFCTPEMKANNKWLLIQDGRQYFDVTCYMGQFYAIDSLGTVVALDGLDIGTPLTRIIITGDHHHFHSLYLLESSGDLLKVIQFGARHKQGQQTDNTSMTFKVFKLDFQQTEWVEVKNLGEPAIFLTSTHSSSVSTVDFPGCKGNCIYFADDGIDKSVNSGIHKYNLEDGTIDTIYSGEQSVILPTPIWYASMQGQW